MCNFLQKTENNNLLLLIRCEVGKMEKGVVHVFSLILRMIQLRTLFLFSSTEHAFVSLFGQS